jgi:hypothetical protein
MTLVLRKFSNASPLMFWKSMSWVGCGIYGDIRLFSSPDHCHATPRSGRQVLFSWNLDSHDSQWTLWTRLNYFKRNWLWTPSWEKTWP